ncbi:MAG: hypothetical protein Ta2D_14040 [Rickettsiales bacterium]|nr:MAG: hypothetical protein Ta2D_14040 [Rickettsiales bacterium]
MPCSKDNIIAWNVNELPPTWFLLNSKHEILGSSNERIIDFNSYFYLKKGDHIEIINKDNITSKSNVYSSFMYGNICLYLYNRVKEQWEIFDYKLSKIITLEQHQIPLTSVNNHFVVIRDKNTLKLFNIENKAVVNIYNYFIGNKYLFIENDKTWERVY